MAALFGVCAAMALIWSAVRYQIVSNGLIKSLPPQFQDDLSSRYAVPVYALSPSTPLPLQADYLKSLAGGCVGMLCFSLALFSAGNVFGWVALVGSLGIAYSTIKSWKTYKENCNRPTADKDEEES